MEILRSPAGCPWDRRQTHASLRRYLIEEAAEAADAIDRRDMPGLVDELGDVLLQCVFHAQLLAERGRFDAADVVDAIARKLIRRHPHVFTADGRRLSPAAHARRQARTADAVTDQWAALKAEERGPSRPRALVDDVPRALPALVRALALGTRAARVGFDWPEARAVVPVVQDELRELEQAMDQQPERAQEELGDLLFAVANLGRLLGLDPDAALRGANDKFARRFADVERRLAARGRTLTDASFDEMEEAWQAVKADEPPASRSRRGGRTRSGRPRASRRSRAQSPRRGRS